MEMLSAGAPLSFGCVSYLRVAETGSEELLSAGCAGQCPVSTRKQRAPRTSYSIEHLTHNCSRYMSRGKRDDDWHCKSHPFHVDIANNTQSTSTLAAELRYEHAAAAVELLAKDEALRKLRVRNALLGDELDDLNEKLCEEFERGDAAEVDAQDWKIRANDLTERLERTLNDLRSRTREMELLKVGAFSHALGHC